MANTIKVSVLGDIRDINKKLGQVDSKLGNLGGNIKKLAGVAVGAFAAIGVTQFTKDIVQSASDVEQSLGATETVFGEYADGIIKSSDKAARAYGLSKNEFLTSSNLIATQLKNQGFAGEELAGKTEDLIGVSSDLAATFGGPTSDATAALGAVLRGEYEQIEKYGVSMKKSDINARLAAQGQDKLTGEALRNAEAMAALDIITEQTADTQGAFARESGTFAHQQQVLAAQIENIKVKLGTHLLPVLTAVGTWLNDVGVPALEAFGSWFGEKIGPHIQTFIGYLQTAWDYIVQFFESFSANAGTMEGINAMWERLSSVVMDTVVPALQGLWTVIQTQIIPVILQMWEQAQPVLEQLWSTFQTVFNGIMDIVVVVVNIIKGAWAIFGDFILSYAKQIWDAVMQTISGALDIIQGVWKTFSAMLKGDWSGMWEGIKQVGVGIWNFIVGFIKTWLLTSIVGVFRGGLLKLASMWKSGLTGLRTAGTSIFNAIKSVINGAMNAVRSTISSVLNSIRSAWSSIWNGIRTTLTNIWNQMTSAITSKITTILNKVRSIKTTITNVFSGAGSWLYNAGRNVVQGLINGVSSLAGSIGTFFLNKVPGWIRGPFKKALGISSPSRLFGDFGKNIGEGLIIGMERTERKIKKATGHMSDSVIRGWETPQLAVAGVGGSRSGSLSAGNTYNITVNSLDSRTAGKVVVDAIKEYERANGRTWNR